MDSMENLNISFIGAGNMTRSIIGGLIADGCDPSTLWVADNNQEQLSTLRQQFPVNTTLSNQEAVANTNVVVLAVKPQVLQHVAHEVSDTAQKHQPLFISIAAGIREQDIRRWLGDKTAIVRTMPNTPSLVQAGASALYANDNTSDEQRNHAETIMRAVGLALWLDDEDQMDIVTGLSGSGPAYFFLIMEALENAACDAGLPKETARLLTLQTGFGATKMALESPEELATLRKRVTSPGGTTEQALNTLEDGNIRTLLSQTLAAAKQRSAELAAQFGKDD